MFRRAEEAVNQTVKQHSITWWTWKAPPPLLLVQRIDRQEHIDATNRSKNKHRRRPGSRALLPRHLPIFSRTCPSSLAMLSRGSSAIDTRHGLRARGEKWGWSRGDRSAGVEPVIGSDCLSCRVVGRSRRDPKQQTSPR